MGEIYYCKNCGGVMEFDVATQSLKCPNCGTEEKIEANRQTVKEHTLTDYAKRTVGDYDVQKYMELWGDEVEEA